MFYPFAFPKSVVYLYTNADCDILADAIHHLAPASQLYYLTYRSPHNNKEEIYHVVTYLPDKDVFVDISGIFSTQADVISWWQNYYGGLVANKFSLKHQDAMDPNKIKEQFTCAFIPKAASEQAYMYAKLILARVYG